MSKSVFDQLKGISSYPCVTVILPTHRTSPDNKQDPIRLKNLLTETKDRLEMEFTRRELNGLKKNLERIEEIDHNHNKEGLAIFINEDTFLYDRLLFKPEERVVIDDTFATRDLIRAAHKAENYYVLIVSQQKARLFECYIENASEVKDDVFPMSNDTLYETDRAARNAGSREDDLIKEFFNRVDKAFTSYYKDNPADLFLMGVERNIFHYMDIVDQKSIISGSIITGGDDATEPEVANLVWPTARQLLTAREHEALSQLERAVSVNRFESDIQSIWKAVNEGRGEVLFVENSFFQPAVIDNGELVLNEDSKLPGVIDDIVDEIAESVLQFGGRVVFMHDGSLSKYQKIALITRY
jgi:hypothetical protein